MKVDWGVPAIPAVLVTVLVFAPLFGGDRSSGCSCGGSPTAPLVAKLVVTIGLMVALMGLAVTIWDPNVGPQHPDLLRDRRVQHRRRRSCRGSASSPSSPASLLAVVIRLVLYRTRLGVAMRAVVDQRELAALNGARPGLTSSFAWGLGTAMAALAGIFLAEELSNLSVETLTLFIVNAFAAAIIGRLKSLPLDVRGRDDHRHRDRVPVELLDLAQRLDG